MTRRKKTVIAVIFTCVAAIGLILYGLADRYLIEHVEQVITDTSKEASAAASDGDVPLGEGSAEAPEDESTAANGEESSSDQGEAAKYSADDWNYNSDQLNIAIKRVTTGSGNDQITYYAADVKTAEASMLKAAFAENAFGRNIIENTSKIASDHEAIFAINGDYYGFRSDGVVVRNGELYRDEPARDAVALYEDGTMGSYDETAVSAESLLQKGVIHTLSFGPALVKNGEVVQNLDNVKIDSNFGNRSISNANPRTGIGMIAPNHYVFVVVDGRSAESRGMTLDEFAGLFGDLGATEAYNLDGGGSSTMYFMGRVVNNPLGRGQERGVSDILYVGGE
ncbi:phosphodiester glycosidase family protein [Paenibacillus sp. GCM10027627]|uniref:phosphodiester glycosidase family protein n=1 Tax=unclassified Paenibacillus TaxID=185978 RepID=UPI00363D2D98